MTLDTKPVAVFAPVEPPEGDCPKCGVDDAFATPYYRNNYLGERLEWPCRRCGFEATTPVKIPDYEPV